MPIDASCKLVPMTVFVIDYYSNEGYADLQTLNLMMNYAQFLKKKLVLGMFIPVDSAGNILKEPKNYQSWKSLAHNSDESDVDTVSTVFLENAVYKKAQTKCYFDGFEVAYNGYSVIRIIASYNHAIELSFTKTDLSCQNLKEVEELIVFDDIFLSKSAFKAIGIKSK